MEESCISCGSPVKNNYCDVCGQPVGNLTINFSYLLSQVISLFNIDRGFLYTIKRLFTSPGEAIREYLAGKRIKYSKPFGFVFIMTTIYIVLSHWLNARLDASHFVMTTEYSSYNDEIRQAMQRPIEFLYSYYAYIQLASIPLCAFFTFMFFREEKYNYAEHWVLNAYILSAQMVIFTAFLPVNAYFQNNLWIYYCILFLLAVYTIWVYMQLFTRSPKLLRFTKAVGATILYHIFIFILTLICSILYYILSL